MTSDEQIQYWIQAAELDIPVAESLFENGKYDWCLFIGHIVLEKILKAHYVSATGNTPPKSHDLVRLSEKSFLQLSADQVTFLERATDFNIEARYPDVKFEFKKQCTKEFTEENFNTIMELYRWLRSLLISSTT